MSANKTQLFLFATWVNTYTDTISIYKGSDGLFYGKSYGLPVKAIEADFAMHLAWNYINGLGGWNFEFYTNPDGTKGKRIRESEEAQELQCKILLKI